MSSTSTAPEKSYLSHLAFPETYFTNLSTPLSLSTRLSVFQLAGLEKRMPSSSSSCAALYIAGSAFALAFFAERLPEVGLHPLEGTYLMWLDMRKTGIEHEALFRRLIDVGGVGLNTGLFFGEQGRGFFRLNLATQRKNVQAGLEGIERALRA